MGRKISLFYIAQCIIVLFTNLSFGQIPESCDCIPNVPGLEAYINSLSLNENGSLKFEVPNNSSNYAVLHGVIDSSTPGVVQTFINNYPNVTTLVFMQMPGSDDDTSNLQAAQLLKNKGYTTYLPSVNAFNQDAFIASGATDMFLSGNKRIIDTGAEVGVHSWSDGTNSATDYAVGHAFHQPYINYYVAMGFSLQDAEAFYYFTINAAPANSIHNMTDSEIDQYKLRTCKYSANPSYIINQSNNTLNSNLDNVTYQWVDCNNSNTPISGATNQSFTPTTNGSYAVMITEGNCQGISNCITINSLSVIDYDYDSVLFNIFPNPSFNKIINIENFNPTYTNTTVKLTDISGKLVYEKEIQLTEHSILNLNTINDGLYFLSLYSNNYKQTFKIILK